MAIGFLASIFILQWAWGLSRGSGLEHAVIDQATVGTAVALIRHLTPDVHALALGPRIKAIGGGINVHNGCEGTELLFLLIAALLAYPLRWRSRLIGLGMGIVFVFVLNQIRLLLLFYSYRTDKALFDQLHGLIAPLVLMMATLVYVTMVIKLDARLEPAPAA
jgi:exosortase/archaeosortase family protein